MNITAEMLGIVGTVVGAVFSAAVALGVSRLGSIETRLTRIEDHLFKGGSK